SLVDIAFFAESQRVGAQIRLHFLVVKDFVDAWFDFFKFGNAGAVSFQDLENDISVFYLDRAAKFIAVELSDHGGDIRRQRPFLHESHFATFLSAWPVGILFGNLRKTLSGLQFGVGVVRSLLG